MCVPIFTSLINADGRTTKIICASLSQVCGIRNANRVKKISSCPLVEAYGMSRTLWRLMALMTILRKMSVLPTCILCFQPHQSIYAGPRICGPLCWQPKSGFLFLANAVWTSMSLAFETVQYLFAKRSHIAKISYERPCSSRFPRRTPIFKISQAHRMHPQAVGYSSWQRSSWSCGRLALSKCPVTRQSFTLTAAR